MNVPFIDLKAQHHQIRDEVRAALDEVMETSGFAGGEKVRQFEQAFAQHVGRKHCIACSSGTAALHLALMALGVRLGDEVIVPDNTFIATAEAVSHCGAVPVFADIDGRDYCIDAGRIAAAVTARTKAVIPVHLYGQSAEMDDILAVARQHGLKVIEDCAQSHAAEYKGRKTGTFGDAAAFSFYPTKNLGAYGGGGAVLVDDDTEARTIHMLREHGSARKHHHEMVGYNYRMDGFQGAVLGVKLKYLAAWTERRRQLALAYRNALEGLPLVLQPPKPHVHHVYHLYVVQVRDRDTVMSRLAEQGVATGIHYPVPLHLTPAYVGLGGRKGQFPVTESCADELLSLPIYPELTEDMVDYVAQCLRKALCSG